MDLGNINVESLNSRLQGRIYQDMPETPFYSYEVLRQEGRIRSYEDINGLLADHPGYRLSEVMQQLKDNQTVFVVCDHTLRLSLGVQLISILRQSYS